MYSRLYLLFEIILAVLLLKWRYRVSWRNAWLGISIFYESIYVLDLFFFIIFYYLKGEDSNVFQMFYEITDGRLLIYILSRMVVLLFVLILLKRKKLWDIVLNGGGILFLVPVVQHLCLIQCDVFFTDLDFKARWAVFMKLILFSVFLAGLFLFFIFYYVYRKYEYEGNLLQEKANAFEQNYKQILLKNKERDLLVHDIKNHFLVLEGLIREEKNEEALGYIEELRSEISIQSVAARTGNVVADTLLSEGIRRAKAAGIQITVEAEKIRESFVKDKDWCVILANLLDNALESCQEAEGRRYIKVRMEEMAYGIVLYVENSCTGTVITRNGELVTSKKDRSRHGLGYQSIGNAIEKYAGTVQYVCRDNSFKVSVVLYK